MIVNQKTWATYFIYEFMLAFYGRKQGHGATKVFGTSFVNLLA